MAEQNEKYFDLVERHLDDVSDPIVLILKSHLLVEEMLNRILIDLFQQPFFEKANLRFHQKMMLVRSLLAKENGDEEELWDAMEAFNSIRNRLAHRLELGDIKELLKRFFVLADVEPTSLDDPDMLPHIAHSVGVMHGMISAHSPEVRSRLL